ncbi:GNAT family N-acetyltransferase [Kaarinaea lacus]
MMNEKSIIDWKISDLSPIHIDTYFCCLEDWSDDIREAGNHKACWYEKFKHKGLVVKLALNNNDAAVGMIQYLPIEESFVKGQNLYFVLCIWVHGHKQGIGDHQGHGIGQALLQAAEDDAEQKGAKGIAAWGLWLPIWMKASWFKKHGYENADREGLSLLVWKAFTEDAKPPSWYRVKKDPPVTSGKVTVAAFINGWCPAQNMTYERTKRASAEFGDKVIFLEYDTSNRDTFLEWGITDAVFVNGKPVSHGPPPSYEKIKKIIEKEIKKSVR